MSLKRIWRILAAGFSYLLFALGASLPAMVSIVMHLLPCSNQTRQNTTRASIRVLCRFYIRLMQWLQLYRYRVQSHNHTDLSGHLVIANHPMLIDALFVMAYLPNVCCIVKPALARNPFTQLTVWAAGFIVADDENLLDHACEAIKAGENLLIFPEGTRNDFDAQLAFKRGAANIAVLAECPILPVVFHCTPRILQKGEKWYQIPDQLAQIAMKIEPSLVVADCIDTDAPRTLQYRTLTQYLIKYYQQRLSE